MPGPNLTGFTQLLNETFSYSGSPPVDPANWFLGDPRPGNAGYGDAKMLLAGDANIGVTVTGGGGSPLSINADYNPTTYHPLYGQDWITTQLNSAWPDGMGGISGIGVRRGYFECEVTFPFDPNAQGRMGGTGTGSGTWGAFWFMNYMTLLGTGPTAELDYGEWFGVGDDQYPATNQWWPLASSGPTDALNNTTHWFWTKQIGNTSGFPTIGDFQGVRTKFAILVDEFNVYHYVNDVLQSVIPLMMPQNQDPFFLMLVLNMGGGWPIVPPTSPATSYSMLVHSVKIYEAPPSVTVTGVTDVNVVPNAGAPNTLMDLTYTTGAAGPPAPSFSPASSPTTSGSAIVIGTASPGTALDTLTVTLNSDSVFSSGSSLALTGASAPYNVEYTPGTITSTTTTSLAFTINDTTNSTFVSPTKNVALTFSSGATPTIVHSVNVDGGGGVLSRTLPTLTCPANTVIVVMGCVTGDTLHATTPIVSSPALTWNVREVSSVGFYPVYEYWASTVSAINVDITVNYASNVSYVDNAVAIAVTGCTSLSAPFDVNVSLPASGTSAPLSVDTTAANTLVLGIFRNSYTAVGVPGSGYTLAAASTHYFMVEYQSFTSPQTSRSVDVVTTGGAINGIADALY